MNPSNPFHLWVLKELAYTYYDPREGNRSWHDILEKSPERVNEFLELMRSSWLIDIRPKGKSVKKK